MDTLEGLEPILARLPEIGQTVRNLREVFLANLVMIGECPAPTFHEQKRIQLITDRFRMNGLDNAQIDDFGNALGILPGKEDKECLAICCHADSVLGPSVDHTISLAPHTVTGAGLSNNALGLAVLASLPNFLDALGFEPRHDILLMGAAQCLGRGNLGGLVGFLDHTEMPVRHGLCLDALQLGRISHRSVGMLRGEIRVAVPKEYDWTRGNVVGALQILCDIVDGIQAIALPRKPLTSVVLGSFHSGSTHNIIPNRAILRFEIRSDSAEMVESIYAKIEELAMEHGSGGAAEVKLETVARRRPGGIEFTHPLTRTARTCFERLDVPVTIKPSTAELAAFLRRDIPALAVGLSLGEEAVEARDIFQIDPIFDGITALIGMILSIDAGLCNHD